MEFSRIYRERERECQKREKETKINRETQLTIGRSRRECVGDGEMTDTGT